MQSWKRHRVEERQFERWKEIIGAENMPETVDRYIVSEYNRNIRAGLTREETLQAMAKKYGWEYKEL